jgi:hypothetical protein
VNQPLTFQPIELPTRTPLPQGVQEKFDHHTAQLRRSMKPRTPEESAICDQIVIAGWFFKRNRSQANAIARRLKKIGQIEPNSEPNSDSAAEQKLLEVALRHHTNQAHRQRNFAWRRRVELAQSRREELKRTQSDEFLAA